MSNTKTITGSKAKAWYHLWSLIVLILVVVAVCLTTNLEDIQHLLMQVNAGWAIAGLGFYLTGHLIRAIRLGYMLEHEPIPFIRLFCWSGLHAVWNYLLPARTGELSLVIYLRRYEQQTTSKVTAVLIAVRGLEMMLTLLLVILIFIPFGDVISKEWKLQIQMGGLLLLATIALAVWLIRRKDWTGFEVEPDQKNSSIWWKFLTFIGRVRIHLQSSLKSPKWLSIVILTMFIWCLNIGMYYTLFPAFGRQIPLAIVVIIVLGMAFAQITPIQSFLSAGSHEIVWVTILSAAGLSFPEAVSFAIGSHILVLTYVLGFAVLLIGLRLSLVKNSLAEAKK